MQWLLTDDALGRRNIKVSDLKLLKKVLATSYNDFLPIRIEKNHCLLEF